MTKKNLHIRVTGKVQGVTFRDSTKEYADQHGIKGLARNEPDGTVYIEAEGGPGQLEALLEWVDHGPAAADVGEVWKDEGEVKDYERFTAGT
jgi:acylphosphatase